MKRAQNKVRRILMLIDALSHLRMPFTINDAHFLVERRDSSIDVCTRTIQRDMELLVSMDFAEVYRKGESGRGGSAGIITQYKMNLRMTASAEMAAKKSKEGLNNGNQNN